MQPTGAIDVETSVDPDQTLSKVNTLCTEYPSQYLEFFTLHTEAGNSSTGKNSKYWDTQTKHRSCP